MPKSRARFVALTTLLQSRTPSVPPAAITEGRVVVDGRIIMNPRARVRADASIRVLAARRLRGERKLAAALDQLPVAIEGRVALDVGASAGGFTKVFLDRGARRVYALDAGIGQLLGSLRNDPRVVNLEGHNLGRLAAAAVPEPVDIVTIDLSYLALADAVPQLEVVTISPGADLVALVKPMFELGLGALPSSAAELEQAVARASGAIAANGWVVERAVESAHRGASGAVELFVHARRAQTL